MTGAVEALSPAELPAAVLIGIDSLQGLQAARALAREGIPIIGIANDPEHDACRTNTCRQIVQADTDSDALLDALARVGAGLEQRAVLLPCEDANVRIVSRHRDRLSEWFHILLPPAAVVELLIDKTRFYEYAIERGLPIPATYFIRSVADLEEVSGHLEYPCVLKPSNSATAVWERQVPVSAFRVSDEAELRYLYGRYARFTDVMIVQQWIDGSDAALHTCNCLFTSAGEAAATFVSRKIRQWPPHVGTGTLAVATQDEHLAAATIRLFEALDFRGLGYVEYKRNPTSGDYVIIEPNIGRPTGRSTIAEAAGVRLLYALYCDALGRPLPSDLDQTDRPIKWVFLRRDFQSALFYWRRGELSLRDWVRSLRGPKAFALFSWRDPSPFLSDAWRVLRRLFRGERSSAGEVSQDTR